MSSIGSINNMTLASILKVSQSGQSRQDPAEKFKELDADGSGGLDKTELSSLAMELSKMMGKTLNVDSSITTYDVDGDGALSQEEMNSLMKDTMGPPPEMGVNGPPDPAEKFAELDTDSNGSLSQSELDAMAAQFAEDTGQTIDMTDAISSYDSDGDGELNQDEMDNMMETMRENGGGPPPPLEMLGGSGLRQASNAYLANSGTDQVSQLRQLMEQLLSQLSAGTGSTDSSSSV